MYIWLHSKSPRDHMTQNLVPSPLGERGGGISKRDIFEKGTSFFAVVLLGVSSNLPRQLV